MLQNQSCAELLAFSAQTACPFLIPIQASVEPGGFHYDFLVTAECDEAILPLITQEMRRGIAQDLPIERLTMMPKNGQDFLQEKQPVQASLLGEVEKNLVELCKIGSFYDL